MNFVGHRNPFKLLAFTGMGAGFWPNWKLILIYPWSSQSDHNYSILIWLSTHKVLCEIWLSINNASRSQSAAEIAYIIASRGTN